MTGSHLPGRLPVPETDPAAVADAAQRVLSRPEYRPPARPLLERVLDWVTGQLDRLIGALAGGGRASVVAWGVLIVSVAAAVVMAARFFRGLSPTGRRSAPSLPGRRVTAEDWRAAALGHEAAGRSREAARAWWRALVAELAARGVVEEVPGRTAGEYRARVAAVHPDGGPSFAAATDLFEAAWYGRRPLTPGDLALLRQQATEALEGDRVDAS